jgi:hypothetical protein
MSDDAMRPVKRGRLHVETSGPAPDRCPICGYSVRPQTDHDVVNCWCGALMWDSAEDAPKWNDPCPST